MVTAALPVTSVPSTGDATLAALPAPIPAPPTTPNGTRNPLAGFGDFIRNLSAPERKQSRDGRPPKRRGPKPDSRPALTRRQELNRQAQRTHRERKENYIKALETQIMQLRDIYAGCVHEKDSALEENERLRQLLRQHGIAIPAARSPVAFPPSSDARNFAAFDLPAQSQSMGRSPGDTTMSSGGLSPEHVQYLSSGGSTASPPAVMPAPPASGTAVSAPRPANGPGSDQIGVDFVLASVPLVIPGRTSSRRPLGDVSANVQF